MKTLFILLAVITSQLAFSSEPMWTCFDRWVKYEVDWSESELNFKDIAYVYTDNMKITGKVIGMDMWSPDIVFFDPNRDLSVVLLLDSSGSNDFYSMHEYTNGKVGRLLTDRVKCEFNY